MSLENEYFNEKQLLENAQERLNKMESLNVENMTQEQLEARDRVIKGAKEEIKECEELLEEIKEELVEFINNGGEVSEKTKEAINYFEPIRVDFKIVSNRNPEVYTDGYVNINDETAEDTDWYYWNGSGYDSHRIIWHDGIEITGATVEQENEIAEFKSDLLDNIDWTNDIILQSDEDENRTHVRGNLTLIINEGAEMECEVTETNDGDYWGMLDFKFNGERLGLDEDLMEELAENIDSTYAQEGRYEILDDTSIACEISKNHYGIYEDDEYYIEETNDVMKSHIEDAKKVFAKQLVRNLGVYGIASRIYEEEHGKLNESACDKFANNWEQGFESEDVTELYLMTEEDVERIIKEELEEDNY